MTDLRSHPLDTEDLSEEAARARLARRIAARPGVAAGPDADLPVVTAGWILTLTLAVSVLPELLSTVPQPEVVPAPVALVQTIAAIAMITALVTAVRRRGTARAAAVALGLSAIALSVACWVAGHPWDGALVLQAALGASLVAASRLRAGTG